MEILYVNHGTDVEEPQVRAVALLAVKRQPGPLVQQGLHSSEEFVRRSRLSQLTESTHEDWSLEGIKGPRRLSQSCYSLHEGNDIWRRARPFAFVRPMRGVCEYRVYRPTRRDNRDSSRVRLRVDLERVQVLTPERRDELRLLVTG